MTEEQAKRIDARLGQIVDLLALLVATSELVNKPHNAVKMEKTLEGIMDRVPTDR